MDRKNYTRIKEASKLMVLLERMGAPYFSTAWRSPQWPSPQNQVPFDINYDTPMNLMETNMSMECVSNIDNERLHKNQRSFKIDGVIGDCRSTIFFHDLRHIDEGGVWDARGRGAWAFRARSWRDCSDDRWKTLGFSIGVRSSTPKPHKEKKKILWLVEKNYCNMVIIVITNLMDTPTEASEMI